jgi:hypothetical protein
MKVQAAARHLTFLSLADYRSSDEMLLRQQNMGAKTMPAPNRRQYFAGLFIMMQSLGRSF